MSKSIRKFLVLLAVLAIPIAGNAQQLYDANQADPESAWQLDLNYTGSKHVLVQAVDGDFVRGAVLERFSAIPEDEVYHPLPGVEVRVPQIGYVELIIKEESTGRYVLFRDEDRTCIKVMNCKRAAQIYKWVEPGMHVDVLQRESYFSGRKSLRVRLQQPN